MISLVLLIYYRNLIQRSDFHLQKSIGKFRRLPLGEKQCRRSEVYSKINGYAQQLTSSNPFANISRHIFAIEPSE
jgi:hypothetical protein